MRQLCTLVGRFESIGVLVCNHSYVCPRGPRRWYCVGFDVLFIGSSVILSSLYGYCTMYRCIKQGVYSV